jgi:translation initiation factor IF-1
MIEGIIIRGLGGNYYVDIGDKMIECRARGLFRLKNIKPLVGDRVLIRITEEDEDAGYIEEIIDRKSEIKRPNIANAQQLIIIFSVKNPEPSFLLMDKLLIAASSNKLDPEHFTCTFRVGSGNNRRMSVNKPSLVEEFVDGVSCYAPYAKNRRKGVGTGPQVGNCS